MSLAAIGPPKKLRRSICRQRNLNSPLQESSRHCPRRCSKALRPLVQLFRSTPARQRRSSHQFPLTAWIPSRGAATNQVRKSFPARLALYRNPTTPWSLLVPFHLYVALLALSSCNKATLFGRSPVSTLAAAHVGSNSWPPIPTSLIQCASFPALRLSCLQELRAKMRTRTKSTFSRVIPFPKSPAQSTAMPRFGPASPTRTPVSLTPTASLSANRLSCPPPALHKLFKLIRPKIHAGHFERSKPTHFLPDSLLRIGWIAEREISLRLSRCTGP